MYNYKIWITSANPCTIIRYYFYFKILYILSAIKRLLCTIILIISFKVSRLLCTIIIRFQPKGLLYWLYHYYYTYYIFWSWLFEDGHTLPKDNCVFQKLAYNGLKLYNNPSNLELVSTNHTDYFSFNRKNYMEFVIKGYNKTRKYQLKIKSFILRKKKPKETINLNFEIPQGYYTKEVLETYIKHNILKKLNTEIKAYSSTEGNITIPLKI